jgi:hypothetical protein
MLTVNCESRDAEKGFVDLDQFGFEAVGMSGYDTPGQRQIAVQPARGE